MWEIDRKSIDKNEVETLQTLWKLDYLRFSWNYLDINYVFESNVTCEVYVVLTPCHMWFLGDHPIWFP